MEIPPFPRGWEIFGRCYLANNYEKGEGKKRQILKKKEERQKEEIKPKGGKIKSKKVSEE